MRERAAFVMVADDVPAEAAYIAELITSAVGPGDGAWWWPYLTAPAAEVVLSGAERLATHLACTSWAPIA